MTVRASRWYTKTERWMYSNPKAKSPTWSAPSKAKTFRAPSGIAHTRWATHGEPNDANAHPHYSQSKTLAIIHNGIIENYNVLREMLRNHDYTFQSDTDTEVLVQLIEYIKQTNHCDLCTAVQLALHEVVGAYAIAVIEKENPDLIVAARKSSPLVSASGATSVFSLRTPRRLSNIPKR